MSLLNENFSINPGIPNYPIQINFKCIKHKKNSLPQANPNILKDPQEILELAANSVKMHLGINKSKENNNNVNRFDTAVLDCNPEKIAQYIESDHAFSDFRQQIAYDVLINSKRDPLEIVYLLFEAAEKVNLRKGAYLNFARKVFKEIHKKADNSKKTALKKEVLSSLNNKNGLSRRLAKELLGLVQF